MEKRLFIEISKRVQLTMRLVSVPRIEPIRLEIINVKVEEKYLNVFIY
jgi:hypothetical protein